MQLAQPSPNGDFSIIESVSYAHPTDKSATRPYPSTSPSTSESVSSSKWRSPYKNLHRTKSLKVSDEKVPFDAIINFLPHGLPDKVLLKNAILVTTLSAQVIVPMSTKVDLKTCSSRSSTNRLSISSPSDSTSSTSFSSSGSTPDTSPCPSPPPRRFSKLVTSKARNRLSFLFHDTPPPPPEVSDINQRVEGSPKVKNTHLVHVLPIGWSPETGAEFHRADKCASSSSSSSRLEGPSHSLGRTGGTCKPKLVQSIEQFLLSFAYPLGSLVPGHFSSSGSGAVLSSPSSNLNQRPKSVPISSTYEKEHSLLHASTLPTLPSMSNFTNINTPLKPVPYLLAPGVFDSCILGSRCPVPDKVDPEQSRDQDTRGDAYINIYTDQGARELTIGEIILFGALDFDHTRPGTGSGNGRAWIGNAGDVVVAGGSPDPDLSPRKVGVRKGKGREVAVMNTEMMKRNVHGLPTPPESSSSNDSADGVDEEQEKETFEYTRPIPLALSTYSSPTHLDDHSTPNTRSKLSKRESSSSIISTPSPTPVSSILNSKQRNDKVRDKDSKRFSDSLSSSISPPPPPLPSPVQLPALVIHRDRARSPRGSEDSYDLGLGHGVPVPPMIVSIKPSSRSASGSGLGSVMIPLQRQGDDARRSAYGETQSQKGSERKTFEGALRKMRLWRNGSGKSLLNHSGLKEKYS
jgi:hypothetical protein